MTFWRIRAAWLGVCAAILALAPAAADDFYKGKRINFIINFAAGGPTDIEGRLFAKYLVKHIAGEPNHIVQNMDGAGGMIGANYLAEIAPKDGTAAGYFTGSAWRYKMTPDKYRVDFRSYEFVGVQPGVSIAFARTDIPPGLKDPTDIVKTRDVVAGGLGPENSKDLMIRLGLDMLGVPHGYVTSYRGSAAARLALQQREINFFAESPPSYRALVEPTLVKSGEVIPIWYDPIYDGESFGVTRQLDGLSILPFHELYRKIKGAMPSGQLWDAYRAVITVNTAMQRLFVLAPGAPRAAVEALSKAVLALNDDKAYQDEAVRSMGFVPDWQAGPDTNRRVRQALSGQPEARPFLNDYIVNRKK